MKSLDWKSITDNIKATQASMRLSHTLLEAHAPGDLPLCFPGRGEFGATGAEYNVRYRPLGMLERQWVDTGCVRSGLVVAWYRLCGYFGPKDNGAAMAILRDVWARLAQDQSVTPVAKQLRATAAFMVARSKVYPCVAPLESGTVFPISAFLSPYGAYQRSLRTAIRYGSRSAILEYQLLRGTYGLNALCKSIAEKYESGRSVSQGIGFALLHVCVWMPTFWYVAWADEPLKLRRDRIIDLYAKD